MITTNHIRCEDEVKALAMLSEPRLLDLVLAEQRHCGGAVLETDNYFLAQVVGVGDHEAVGDYDATPGPSHADDRWRRRLDDPGHLFRELAK